MADKKPKLPTFTTPEGIAIYPRLNAPSTKFKAEGVYECKLAVPEDAAAPLIAQLVAIRDEYFDNELDAKQKKKFSKAEVAEVELDDEGEETGRIIFKTKLNASGVRKDGTEWTQEPKLFDSQGNPSNDKIGGGSKLILAGTVKPYAMDSSKSIGVSLQVRGVQIIELVEWGDRSAESFGFGPRDGHVTDAAKAGFGNTPEDNDDSDDQDDDGEF